MSDRSPFDFDMRVTSDKKKRTRGKRGMSGAFETSTRGCDHPGCEEAGQYRAPKSPDHLDEYLWFCRDHVREYNLKWNFFSGADRGRISRSWSIRTASGGARPSPSVTRASSRHGSVWASMTRWSFWARRPPRIRAAPRWDRKLPPTERKALEILDAKDSWTRTEIRKQYKVLVKDLHPDMNGGNRADEDRLQEVVWAWDQIKESRFFKD